MANAITTKEKMPALELRAGVLVSRIRLPGSASDEDIDLLSAVSAKVIPPSSLDSESAATRSSTARAGSGAAGGPAEFSAPAATRSRRCRRGFNAELPALLLVGRRIWWRL